MVASSRHGPVSNREWRQWSHMLHNWKKPYKCSYCWKTKKEKKTKTKTNKNKNVHFVRLRDIYIKPKKKKIQHNTYISLPFKRYFWYFVVIFLRYNWCRKNWYFMFFGRRWNGRCCCFRCRCWILKQGF